MVSQSGADTTGSPGQLILAVGYFGVTLWFRLYVQGLKSEVFSIIYLCVACSSCCYFVLPPTYQSSNCKWYEYLCTWVQWMSVFFSSGRLNAVNSQIKAEQWPVITVRQKIEQIKNDHRRKEMIILVDVVNLLVNTKTWFFFFSPVKSKEVKHESFEMQFYSPKFKKKKDFRWDLPSLGDISSRDICLLSSMMELQETTIVALKKIISSVSLHKSWPGYSR